MKINHSAFTNKIVNEILQNISQNYSIIMNTMLKLML